MTPPLTLPMTRVLTAAVLSLLLVVAPLATAHDAQAQTAASSAASLAGPAGLAVTPTPAEAQQLLTVLQDAAKRQQLVRTLQAIAAAPVVVHGGNPASLPASSAATPPVTASSAAPITPPTAPPRNPLTVVLGPVLERLSSIAHGLVETTITVTHLPVLWQWLIGTLGDAAMRVRLLISLGQLSLLLVSALAAQWIVRRLLRRPYLLLAGIAPSEGSVPPAESAEAARATALPPPRPRNGSRHAPSHSLAQALHVAQRLPFVIAGLGFDLLPVLTFALVGNLGVTGLIGGDEATNLALLAVINAYALYQAILCLCRVVVTPVGGRVRLFAIKDATALYAETWLRRIVGVAVFGGTAAHITGLFGLPEAAVDALVKVVGLVDHLLVIVVIIRCREAVAAWIRPTPGRRTGLAALRTLAADYWHAIAIFYVLAFWAIWAIEIKDGAARLLTLFCATVAVLAVSRGVFVVALGGLEHASHGEAAWTKRYPAFDTHARRYYGPLRSLVWALVTAATAAALLQVWGVDVMAWFADGTFGSRLMSSLMTVAVAVLIAIVIWEAMNAALDSRIGSLTQRGQSVRSARLRTLLPIVRTALMVTLLLIVGMTALSEIGVNIAPLLAGAGIIGVAIGFGSQKLVQDLITGLFLLIENAMQVGDWVTVAGLSGSVEMLSIRTIRLRAGDGSVHIIPFSSVTSVTNTNRGIGNAAVSVNVAISENIDRVCAILKDIALEMRRDPDFKPLMLSDLQLWGVDKVDAAAVTLVGQIVCTDSGRWGVQRDYNRRLKERFQAEGIEIANLSQTVIVQTPRDQGEAAARTAAENAKAGDADNGTPASRITSPPPAALSNQH